MLTILLTAYYALTAATLYFIGFEYRGTIYGGYFAKLPVAALRMDHESTARGGAMKIRLRFDRATKTALIAAGAVEAIGPAAILTEDSTQNRGDNFERVFAEMNGLRWAKNSTPFWVAGDLEINGEQVQVKFDGAEIVNEKSLRKAQAATA